MAAVKEKTVKKTAAKTSKAVDAKKSKAVDVKNSAKAEVAAEKKAIKQMNEENNRVYKQYYNKV